MIHDTNERLSIERYATSSNAAYVIDGEIGLYVKHSATRMSPWRFSFQKIHQDEILQMKKHVRDVFLILAYGDNRILALPFEDIKTILDDSHGEVEWVSAARIPRKKYTVKGSNGSLVRKSKK